MERVTFIVSETGARINCMLNPEHLVQRRYAGLRRPWSGSGPITGAGLSDDVLLHTGGGTTEIDLDLLFDTRLGGEPQTNDAPVITDVRQLTRPLWDLAENHREATGNRRASSARFFWGKENTQLVVVVAVAERLERFDSGGTPTRSWLRLRLRRIPDPNPPAIEPAPDSLPSPGQITEMAQTAPAREVHVALGAGADADGNLLGGERLDELASRFYEGRPWLWRLIAEANGLNDAPFAPAGAALVIPDAPPEVAP